MSTHTRYRKRDGVGARTLDNAPRPTIRLVLAGLAAALCLLGACASKPRVSRSGFLSDYSRLERVTDSHWQYVSPRLDEYGSFTVDPVEARPPAGRISEEERAEIAAYFRQAARDVIQSRGLELVESPGPGVARVRLALTDVSPSVWWQKIHPASRLAGAGTGGAAMEGEIVDTQTGEQLAAIIRADAGNQFNPTAFSTAEDVRAAIDKWAAAIAKESTGDP